MKEISPIAEGLLMIHKIITRGLATSLRKCDEYLMKRGLPPGEASGFTMYVATFSRVTHAHHLSEDDIAFPYFKDHLEAPYDKLKNDHRVLSGLIDTIDQYLPDLSINGVGKLREVLGEFENVWRPHISSEEENFTAEKLQSVAGIKEQENIVGKLAAHSSQNAGPGPLALPFMFYNLEGRERELFMKSFPWIVKRVLVPVIWKKQWNPMTPFLLQING